MAATAVSARGGFGRDVSRYTIASAQNLPLPIINRNRNLIWYDDRGTQSV